MKLNQLGASDLWLTRIGFGAWAVGGGDWAFSWGPQDDNASIAAIHHAIDLGVNWIDTAAVYGLGHSEEIVGKAVKSSTVKPLVFTKCGMVWNEKREIRRTLLEIRREVEESLRRLQLEAIDLYQIHWPIPAQNIEEGWAALAELKEHGLVRHIGVSNFDVEQLRQIQQIAPVETLQPQYSLIEREIEREILPFAREHRIGVIAYSPMGSGMLTGAMTRERAANLPENDWRKHDTRFNDPQLSRNLQLVDRLTQVADRYDTTPGAIAVAWALHNPAVDGAIVGFRRPDQVDPILTAANLDLTDEDIAEIEGSTR